MRHNTKKMSIIQWVGVFVFLLAASVIAENGPTEVNELPLAKRCNETECVLPKCRCSSTSIPGGLEPRDVPQFVTVTFDDGVNINNILTYRDILFNRVNKNGCRVGATFYVSHEYTNYQIVNELYNNGFEIALHSITHQTPQSYWAEATYDIMVKQFAEQKKMITHFANIPEEAIKGMRIPFLQMAGNASFQMMADHGLEYDCSWPTTAHIDPGLWPYTLDYASIQDCHIQPCPTASIPGKWVLPMIAWRDLNGFPCAMVDACFSIPDRTNEEEWFRFILSNFERHYLGNRAPFGFYVHEAFLSAYPAVNRALSRFFNLINSLNDVFMVNSAEVIDWVKDPVPIDEYKQRGCPFTFPSLCRSSSCGPLSSPHTEMQYWMQACNSCPRVYPWINNPLGQ